MTPEQELIEAVLEADGAPAGLHDINAILTTPTVQAALAKVRGGGCEPDFYYYVRPTGEYVTTRERVVPEEGEAEIALYAATPKSEPVLRWEGKKLWLDGVEVGEVWRAIHQWGWAISPGAKSMEGFAATKAEARTAAEQAVRDWLARAGLV